MTIHGAVGRFFCSRRRFALAACHRRERAKGATPRSIGLASLIYDERNGRWLALCYSDAAIGDEEAAAVCVYLGAADSRSDSAVVICI